MAKSKSDREVVLNVLNRTFPEYTWGYATLKLGNIYEGRKLSLAAIYSQWISLKDEGAIEEKRVSVEETHKGIEALVESGKIKNGEIIMPDVERTGYRLTEKGKLIRIEELETQTGADYSCSSDLSPAPA